MKELNEILASMAALETAIAAIEQRDQLVHQKAPWAERAAAEIEPTRWTCRIEAAFDKPAELNSLRVQYDELVLAFVSALLSYEHDRRQYMDAISPLCDGIKELVKVLDDPASSSLPRHLKPAIQALVLRAISAHRAPRAESEVRSMDSLSRRSREYGILVSAFTALADNLGKLNVQYPRYSTDLVIVGRDFKPVLSSGVDLRSVWFVPFVDCVNSQHPHNVALTAQHSAVEAALGKVRDLIKTLKSGPNGTINERQHASRMLDWLHGAPQGCGGSMEHQVSAQQKRRLQYETVRLQVVMALDDLQVAYDSLIVTLAQAGAETATLLAETQADDRTTIDRLEAVRVAMNNCLAADLYLRRVGREIAELKGTQARDLSLGNGATALAAAYDEAAQSYRY